MSPGYWLHGSIVTWPPPHLPLLSQKDTVFGSGPVPPYSHVFPLNTVSCANIPFPNKVTLRASQWT